MIKGVFAHFFILSPRRKCYKSILFFRSNRVGWVFWPGHLYAPSGTAGTGCPLRAAASPICGAQLRNCCRRTAWIPSQRAWHQTGDVVHRTVPKVVGCTHVNMEWFYIATHLSACTVRPLHQDAIEGALHTRKHGVIPLCILYALFEALYRTTFFTVFGLVCQYLISFLFVKKLWIFLF